MEIKYKRRRYIGAISLLSWRPHSGRISCFSYFSLSSLSLQLHFPFVEFIDVIVLLLERFLKVACLILKPYQLGSFIIQLFLLICVLFSHAFKLVMKFLL